MRALRVLGIAENGTQVVCQPVADVTDTDAAASVRAVETFALPVDERLRAAVRGDLSRIGQLEIEMESQLRPREIQQRIRAGSTVEQVAAAAGCSPDRIERYAYPVLLERSTIAERARLAHPVIDGSAAALTVEEIVAQTLGTRGQQSAVTWDAFRDERGWALRASWRAGRSENRATWSYHAGPAGGTVVARDEGASMLVDPAQRPLRRVGPDRVGTGSTGATGRDTREAATHPAIDPETGTAAGLATGTGAGPATGRGAIPATGTGAGLATAGDREAAAESASAVDEAVDDDALDEERRLVADTVSDARSGSRPAAGRRAESRPASPRAAAGAVPRAGEIGVRGRDTGTEGRTVPGPPNHPSGGGTSGGGTSGGGTSGGGTSGGGTSGGGTSGSPAAARGRRGQRPTMPSWEDVLLGTRTGR